MPLSNDICRCHDDDCPSREICERYKRPELETQMSLGF